MGRAANLEGQKSLNGFVLFRILFSGWFYNQKSNMLHDEFIKGKEVAGISGKCC